MPAPSLFKMKTLFFDRDRVVRAVDRARHRVLSKQGAFLRTRARSIIRPRKTASAPGEPPHSHTGILRRFIYFCFDPATRTVVVGPARTNQVFFDKDRRPVKGTVPGVLEHGGQVTILEVNKYGRWRRADLRSKRRLAGLPTRYRTVTIRPRPYMSTALALERKALPELWRDSVRRAA
jgi:hypothetical protein